MRAFLLLVLFFPLTGISQQRFHVTVFGGLSNYSGDLQGKEFTVEQSNFAFGLGVKYDLTAHWALRSSLTLASVEGDDKLNDPLLQFRNLSFRSKITEGNLLLEYTFMDLENKRLSPYLFAGVAVYHFNPYAFVTLGNKVFLKPLSTEGQGLGQYPDRQPYKLTQFAIPFGGGVKFRINYNTVLSYEIGLRKLYTDYLDDVSTTYVDQFVLAQERGLKAVEMAYRAGELKGGDPTYPVDGTIRGGSRYKDWYYMQGLTLTIGINGKGGFGGGRRGGKYGLDCPLPVY
jgi:hypothetical protein